MKSTIAAVAFASLACLAVVPAQAAGAGAGAATGGPGASPLAEQVHWRHRHHHRWHGRGWAYPGYYGFYYAPRHYWPYWRRGYRSRYWY